MKTWHWIAIGLTALVVVYVIVSSRASSSEAIEIVGPKVGSGKQDFGAGAPPLPNVNMALPSTASVLTFTRQNSFGRKVFS